MQFELNNDIWHVFVVDPDSDLLVDRTNTRTVATTDPATYSIYLSSNLGGDLLVRVLIHEISHCILVSYDLLGRIHRMTKKRYWIEMEELICNVVANYVMEITKTYIEISQWYSRRFV